MKSLLECIGGKINSVTVKYRVVINTVLVLFLSIIIEIGTCQSWKKKKNNTRKSY